MKYRVLIFSLILAISCSNESDEEQYKSLTEPLNPFEINNSLGRGINLGNGLEAPNEGDWGFVLKAEYFEQIKDLGFSSVRIPIRWSAHTSDEAPYTIDSTFFARVDWAINNSIENDLYAIINVHHYEEIFENPADEREKFLSMWTQISNRYKDYPKELVFEVLNEPHNNLTAELWNQLLPDAVDVIREENPYRTLVIGAAEWGGIPGMEKLALPNDSNLILTVHYYEPFQFTHQGAEWNEGADEWLGTTWDGTGEEVLAVRNHFEQIQAWAALRNIPVNIGEFGAYSKADMASRARWTSTVVKTALDYSMSYHYWEFGSGFGIYSPSEDTWHIELINALLKTE